MKLLYRVYPSLVGILLGLIQTGLFFQLTFTLSSSFRTFLMITVCWLLGSAMGIRIASQTQLQLNHFLVIGLLAYFTCPVVLGVAPFNTQLWPVYAILILLTGLYPGVFFVRLSEYYTARQLFFRENNGFIAGLVGATLLFLMLGRAALWGMPILVAVVVMLCTTYFLRSGVRLTTTHNTFIEPIESTA